MSKFLYTCISKYDPFVKDISNISSCHSNTASKRYELEQVSRKIYEDIIDPSSDRSALVGIEINCVCNYLGIIKPKFYTYNLSVYRQPCGGNLISTMETNKNNAGFSNTSET